MSTIKTTTSWTPARGDVIGWPFVWRHVASGDHERFAGVFGLACTTELVLVGFSNPAKPYRHLTPVDFMWRHKDGDIRDSRLYREAIEVNLVPAGVVKQDVSLIRGFMDDDVARLVERLAFGSIMAAADGARVMNGARWVAPYLYVPVEVRKDNGALAVRQLCDEPFKTGILLPQNQGR